MGGGGNQRSEEQKKGEPMKARDDVEASARMNKKKVERYTEENNK